MLLPQRNRRTEPRHEGGSALFPYSGAPSLVLLSLGLAKRLHETIFGIHAGTVALVFLLRAEEELVVGRDFGLAAPITIVAAVVCKGANKKP